MYYRGIIVVLFNHGLVEKQLFITDERVTLNKYISNKNNKARFAEMLRAVKWETMFRMKSCNEQYILYETVINHLMCQCFPNKTVTCHSGDKPWVTDWFRSLVRKRQRAHMQGDQAQARLYRNEVNRAVATLRKEFYQDKITALKASSSRAWWKHMKSLLGSASIGNAEMQTLANRTCKGNIELLADKINEFLVSVSSSLPRLYEDHPVFNIESDVPDDYIISVITTEEALSRIKSNKAMGPDNVPGFVLRDNASTRTRSPISMFIQ